TPCADLAALGSVQLRLLLRPGARPQAARANHGADAPDTRTLETSPTDDAGRPRDRPLPDATGGRPHRVSLLRALHRSHHGADRGRGSVLAYRRRWSLRELGDRIAPVPLSQAAPGQASEAVPHHRLRQLVPVLGGGEAAAPPLAAVQLAQFR